jgi:hypothetical protein
MAITKIVSNKFKLELGKAAVNFLTDTFKAVLMLEGFVYNRDTHGTLASIAASIISATGGYAAQTLSVIAAWNQDDVNDLAFVDWSNVTWTASAAPGFDYFNGVIIYNDTHADKVVVGHIGLGQVVTLTDGNSFQLRNIGFEIKDV